MVADRKLVRCFYYYRAVGANLWIQNEFPFYIIIQIAVDSSGRFFGKVFGGYGYAWMCQFKLLRGLEQYREKRIRAQTEAGQRIDTYRVRIAG